MEQKWLHEKSCREAAETKLKALKKKTKPRAVKEGNAEMDEVKEDCSVSTQYTAGGRHSRTNSLDAIETTMPDPAVATGNGSHHGSLSNVDAVKSFDDGDGVSLKNAGGAVEKSAAVTDQAAAQATESGAKISAATTMQSTKVPSPQRDSAASAAGGGNHPRTPPVVTQRKVPAGAGNGSRGALAGTNSQPKPNHVQKQQEQQQKSLHSPGSNHQQKTTANGEPNQYAQSVARPLFAGSPGRPMGTGTRNESTGSLGSARRSTSCDFDPLGPLHQDQQSEDGGSVVSNPTYQLYTTSPVYMMDPHQQTMTMVTTSQTPMMQVSHQQMDPSSSMGMAQGFPQPQSSSSSMGPNQLSSGMFLVPPQVTMRSFLEQPALSAANGTQEMMQPQMMMTFQQAQPLDQQQQQQSTPWIQQQQQPAPTMQHSEAPLQLQQDPISTTTSQAPNNGATPAAVDPFDELVQQRRS